jgi:hypothetical protein
MNKVNAFQVDTKKGNKVFRVTIDTNEILSNLEQGKTIIRYDIMCDKYGNPIVARGTAKTGKPWRALMYYTWAQEKKNEDNKAA